MFIQFLLDAVVDGGVHPLSSYTLNLLSRLFTFDSALPVLFGSLSESPPSPTAAVRYLLVRHLVGGIPRRTVVGDRVRRSRMLT